MGPKNLKSFPSNSPQFLWGLESSIDPCKGGWGVVILFRVEFFFTLYLGSFPATE